MRLSDLMMPSLNLSKHNSSYLPCTNGGFRTIEQIAIDTSVILSGYAMSTGKEVKGEDFMLEIID